MQFGMRARATRLWRRGSLCSFLQCSLLLRGWRQCASRSISLLNSSQFPSGGREVHCSTVLSFTGHVVIRCGAAQNVCQSGSVLWPGCRRVLHRVNTIVPPIVCSTHLSDECCPGVNAIVPPSIECSTHLTAVHISTACSSQPADVPCSKKFCRVFVLLFQNSYVCSRKWVHG